MLPPGKDPDDLVKDEARVALTGVIETARPLAEMLWVREAGAGVYETPESRAELEARLRQDHQHNW